MTTSRLFDLFADPAPYVAGARQPYLIAEIGVNHEGSLERAKAMVSAARRGGADAAKFQTYKAERLASKHSPAYWDLSKEPTTSQFALFKKHDSFGDKEYLALAAHCQAEGIDFMSTPFDLGAVEFLDPLMPAFKVASADLTNVPLLRAVARKGKPVILSTGASTVTEAAFAVNELVRAGARQVALLHCVLSYPTKDADAHINMIEGLRRAFPGTIVGYSDHTVPDAAMTVMMAAFAKGAPILEKHFTDNKTLQGNDHYHAMDEADVATFRRQCAIAVSAAGDTLKHVVDAEQAARLHARRSIVLARAVRRGERLEADALICKRPAHGVSPMYWDEIVGRTAARDLEDDHVLQWSDVEPEGARAAH